MKIHPRRLQAISELCLCAISHLAFHYIVEDLQQTGVGETGKLADGVRGGSLANLWSSLSAAHFSALQDSRQAWKGIYPLPEILLLILSARIVSAEDCVEIEEWGE
jgi:hypothetical protein